LGGQFLAYLVALSDLHVSPFQYLSKGMVTFSAKILDGSGCGLLQQHLLVWSDEYHRIL
jgi:hypothetical protein